MSEHATTRRALLTAVAAVPAVALLPVASRALEQLNDPIIELAERTIQAWEDHGAACRAFEPFDLAMMDWRDANPPPKSASRETVKAEYDAAGQVLNRTELGEQFVSIFDKSHAAEVATQTAAEERAMANWLRRERAGERRIGYTKADAAAAAACHASAELNDELKKTHPQTIAGLFAKARAASLVCLSDLNDQLVWDIGLLAGEVTAAENAATRYKNT